MGGLVAHNVAIGDREGPVELHVSNLREASSLYRHPPSLNAHPARGEIVETISVRSTTLPAFLSGQNLESVDLVKVDIEGAESALFAATDDETLQAIGQITVEFHQFMDLTSGAQIAEIVERLRSLGFFGIRFALSIQIGSL